MAKSKLTKRGTSKKSTAKSRSKPASRPKKAVPQIEVLDEDSTIDVIAPEIIDDDTDDGNGFDSTLTEPVEVESASTVTALTSTDPMARYMQEVRRYPLLTREQEQKLAVRYFETRDPKAAEALVTSNLRFVVKVAAEYTKFGATLFDLVQEGNVGLMHAVRDFNPYKGVRLITYAVWWIRGYIQEFLMRQYSMVRIGTTATQRKLFYQLQKQRRELEKLRPEEAVALLSGKLGVDPEDVRSMQQRLSGRDVSLDKPLSEENSGTTLMDLQGEDTNPAVDEQLGGHEEVSILQARIERLRPSLSEKEQIILDRRLLADEPATLQEIGDDFKVTREAVRQMEARLIEKIRAELPDLIARTGQD